MKLQFAFGNPRKKVKKAGKTVARRRKAVKHKGKAHPKKRKSMAKRHKAKKKKHVKFSKKRHSTKKRGHSKKKKNPVFTAKKDGKLLYKSPNVPSTKKTERDLVQYRKVKLLYDNAPGASKEKAKYRKQLAAITRKVDAVTDVKRVLAKYNQDGASISESKGAKVAKRRKKRKSKKSSVKAASKPKRHKRRKSSKRKHKKSHVTKHAAPKKARRRRKKRAKTYAHRHAKATRHLKKGATGRVTMSFGKGRKKVRASGKVRINPRRSNPMQDIEKHIKTYTGMSGSELGALAIGGALVPIINSGITKVPGGATVVTFVNQYLGPQAAGSVIPLLAGAAFNALGEHVFKTGAANKYAHLIGEGLVAAGVIGLAMSVSQQYLAPALTAVSGINFTPRMSGINYTPRMGSINYTPRMGVQPQMGIMPRLNGTPQMGASDYGGGGGYTEDHKTSRSDFGRMGADADFGSAMDMDSDEIGTEDDIAEDSMSGSMN